MTIRNIIFIKHNLTSDKEPNKVKSAYNRVKYEEPMRGLIEWYADYLDGVKDGIYI